MDKIKSNDLIYPDLSYKIVGAAFQVFNKLGFGHKEIYYQRALVKELEAIGLPTVKEKAIPFQYKDEILGYYKPDVLVEDKIVVELKVRPKIGYVHINQVLGYLRAANIKLAIIIYFTKEGVKYRRIINAG